MKKLIVFLLGAVLMLGCTGCGNKDLFDTVFTYNTAIISMPNGEVVEGTVTGWCDYDNSDQIQVCIDGKTYLVHSEDIVLIAE